MNEYGSIEDEINQTIRGIVNKKQGTKKRVNSIKKGHTFEREMAKKLTELLGIKIVRVPMSGGFATLNDSNIFPGDLMAANDKDIFKFEIECKHYNKDNIIMNILNKKLKNVKIFDWIEQSTRDALKRNSIPIIIFKINRKIVLTILRTKEIGVDKNWFLLDKNNILMFRHFNTSYIITPFDNLEVKRFHDYLKGENNGNKTS